MPDESTLTGNAVVEVAVLARQGAAVQKFKVGSRDFTDRPIYRVDLDRKLPQPVAFLTLKGFCDFLGQEKAATDAVVQVVSPNEVRCLGELEGEDENLRPVYATAICAPDLKGFRFNEAVSLEALNIALQTCFEPERGDVEALRRFCASVKSTQSLGIADDGVSQTVEARRGIAAVQTTPAQAL